jgi:hypothetical protein
MSSDLILIDRELLLAELRRAFDAPTSGVLLNVLDKVAGQVQAASVKREDFSELKQIMAELAEAQKRTEARFEELAEAQKRTETRLEELAEAQKRTETRLEELAEAQKRTEARLEELAEAQKRTEVHLGQLAQGLQRVSDTFGEMRGMFLEIRYENRAVAYFGRILRRPRVTSLNELWDRLEAVLPPDVLDDVLLLDLLVQGVPRQATHLGEVWLAVEISAVVDNNDVGRARRRAQALQQAGYRAIPVVAGEGMTEGARQATEAGPIVVVQDGQISHWDAALSALVI